MQTLLFFLKWNLGRVRAQFHVGQFSGENSSACTSPSLLWNLTDSVSFDPRKSLGDSNCQCLSIVNESLSDPNSISDLYSVQEHCEKTLTGFMIDV